METSYIHQQFVPASLFSLIASGLFENLLQHEDARTENFDFFLDRSSFLEIDSKEALRKRVTD